MRRTGLAAAAVLLLSGALAACATPGPSAQDEPRAPQSTGLVTTGGPVTVLDDGDGAELCLGGVATSLPPQCGGPALIGWDWGEWDGDYEEVSGVRWGEFIVTGAYDAAADEFTPTEVRPGADHEYTPDHTMPDFSTRCPEPAGGWRVLDESMTTFDSMNATFERAASLEGYATSWVDQSPNPVQDPYDEAAMNDPLLTIVNVAVTGDVAQAEAELRTIWGGMLCVSQAERTQAELMSIMDEIMSTADGFLGGGPAGIEDVLEIWVVYDDGSLQSTLDQRHGEGVVRVDSALQPVG